MKTYDLVIIGSGIVGLSVAYFLRRDGYSICVVDGESIEAFHQTGHNSGVIHAGLYYLPGSLKAKNCFYGRKLLLDFCKENEILFETCGKLIVATSPQETTQLNTLITRGQANGLEGLKPLAKEALGDYEPHVKGVAGLFVPQTGIVDYKKVAQVLRKKCEDDGVSFLYNWPVKKVSKIENSFIVKSLREELSAKFLLNCAGLQSDRIAKMCGLKPNLKIIPFRGDYYELVPERRGLVRNLIYPVPDPRFPFLGVHFTRRIDGSIEAGPNAVLALAREVYSKFGFNFRDVVDSFFYPGLLKVMMKYWKTGMEELVRAHSQPLFTKALKKLIPEVNNDDIVYSGCGIRAQAIDKKGNLIDDFRILKDNKQIHVLNAPSPAATASLAIGESIGNMFKEAM